MQFKIATIKSTKADIAKGEATLTLRVPLDDVLPLRETLEQWIAGPVQLVVNLNPVQGTLPGFESPRQVELRTNLVGALDNLADLTRPRKDLE